MWVDIFIEYGELPGLCPKEGGDILTPCCLMGSFLAKGIPAELRTDANHSDWQLCNKWIDEENRVNELVLEVETISGHSYYLTYKDSLSDTQWLPEGGAVAGNGLPMEFEVSTTNAPTRFYRCNID